MWPELSPGRHVLDHLPSIRRQRQRECRAVHREASTILSLIVISAGDGRSQGTCCLHRPSARTSTTL